jgi:hypothetical protein
VDPLERIVDSIEGLLSIAALGGFLILVPLYLSQRRDIARLRAWMEREPDHPAVELAASETILDRAEAELEDLLAERGEGPETLEATEIQPPRAVSGVTPLPPARRVTSERPALERITLERAALEPHPRWRHFAARVNQPRYLAAIALVAVVVGGAAILASEELLQRDEGGGRGPRPGAVVPAEVEVAVLNGTSVPGLAAKVGDDVESNGFELGDVGTSEREFEETVVMFEPGQERAGRRVARDLGEPVQPIDAPTRRASGGADVVVIAGQDRAI